MKKFSFLLIVFSLVLLGAGCGEEADKGTPSAVTPPAGEKPTAPDTTVAQPGKSSSEIVNDYMLFTLGTLPGAKVDYEQAKPLMSEEFRTQFVDTMFIPMTYGIQDGPEKIKIIKNYQEAGAELVDVQGYWGGEAGKVWTFRLIMEDGQLKIDGIMFNE